MALPQKVIEQLGRESPRTPGWSGQLLMFSSTVFFICLLIYFGVTYGYEPYLQSQVESQKRDIQTFGQKIPLEKQAQLVGFYSQVANLEKIFRGHVIDSPIFEWLEKNTQVNVYFDKASLDVPNGKLSLNGKARTMNDVNQQLAIFQSQPEVQKMIVSSVNFSKGLWEFSSALIFDPVYFSPASSTSKL